MSLTCIQPDSTSLGGIPGRLGTFRAWRQVPTIWILEECHIQRQRKRRHRDVRESVISECVLFLKREIDRTEQEEREKDCAHTSQREKEFAPTKKSIHVGSIDSPWCSQGYTNFKMEYEAEMNTEIFGVRRYQILDWFARGDRGTLGQIQHSPPRVRSTC